MLRALDRALGRVPDPREPFVPPPRYEGSLVLPSAVRSVEPLLFAARRLLLAVNKAEGMNRAGLPGVLFRPAVFEPTFQKHAKTTCAGCQIHVLDRQAFRPVETGVALIAAFRAAPFLIGLLLLEPLS